MSPTDAAKARHSKDMSKKENKLKIFEGESGDNYPLWRLRAESELDDRGCSPQFT